jgi:membrane protein
VPSVTERFDRFQQRHRVLGFPIAVIYKFTDDQGGYLAALVTYYGFLSIFPLLLLSSSVLGFVLQDNPGLQQDIIDSALGQFPVIGQQLGDPQGLRGSTTAVAIGLVGSLYGALGVAQATQNAMNVAWAVPRNRRPNPFASRARSLLLLAVGGVTLVLTGVLSGVGNNIGSIASDLGSWLRIAATVLSIAINALFFGFVFRVSTARDVPWTVALPGAIGAAVCWQFLQSFGAAYVGEVVRRADATNGVFAIVLGLIAWIYLAAVSVLLCVQANVVYARRLYPRTLLTPFTDDVDLTDADQRAYVSYAKAQRTKGFESVEVTFEHDGQFASATREAASQADDGPHHAGDASSDDSSDDNLPGDRAARPEPRIKEL